MNQPLTASEPARSVGVRWTLSDLMLVFGAAIAIGAALLLVVQLSVGVLGRGVIDTYMLLLNMLAGALVYGAFVIGTQLVIVGRRRGTWREIGFRLPTLLPILLAPLIFVGQLILLLVVQGIMVVAFGAFDNPQQDALTDPRGFSWLNFVVALSVIAVVAPIVEELLFRGLLYQWLRARIGVVFAIAASALIFAVAHVIPSGVPALFGSAEALTLTLGLARLLPALAVIGVVLALAFEWAESLWLPIALHMMQNALATIAFFAIQANPQLVPAS